MTITLSRDKAQQVLEALNSLRMAYVEKVKGYDPNERYEKAKQADTAMREALAEPEQEPVFWNVSHCWVYAENEQQPFGWVKTDELSTAFDSVGCGTIYKTAGEDRQPLYATSQPVNQEPVAWIDPTEEQLMAATGYVGMNHDDLSDFFLVVKLCKELNAPDREKNRG